jgi:hypothetical protein
MCLVHPLLYPVKLICLTFYSLEEEEDKSIQEDNHRKKNKYGPFVPFVQKKPVSKQPESVQLEEDDL